MQIIGFRILILYWSPKRTNSGRSSKNRFIGSQLGRHQFLSNCGGDLAYYLVSTKGAQVAKDICIDNYYIDRPQALNFSVTWRSEAD